jgi:hypothetical protein
MHRVFLVQPPVFIDKKSGRARLERSDYSAEYLSAHIEQRTLELADGYLEQPQEQLAPAPNIPDTRTVARKLLENMMQRALARGDVSLPAVLGGGTIQTSLRHIGKATTFHSEPTVRCTCGLIPSTSPPS